MASIGAVFEGYRQHAFGDVSSYITVVSNQRDGIVSYGTSDILYERNPEELSTSGGRPINLLFSDRQYNRQPFLQSAPSILNVTITPAPSVRLNLPAPFNRDFTFTPTDIAGKVVGVTPAIGGNEFADQAVWVISLTLHITGVGDS